MRLTIIRPDNMVYIDGEAISIDCSTLPADVHAVQWSDDAGKGWIEFEQEPFGSPKLNEEIFSRSAYASLISAWEAERQRLQNADDSFAPPA